MNKIILLTVLFFNSIIYNDKLEEVNINDINNSVIIALDNLYCKDCLTSLLKISNIWIKDYKTILLTRSKIMTESMKYKIELFKDYFKFDKYLFLKIEKEIFNKNFIINNINITNTPIIIIKNNSNIELLTYTDIFNYGIDTNSIKKNILKYLNAFEK